MIHEPAPRERTVVAAVSLPLIVAGLGAVAMAAVWPDRAAGIVVVVGASVALAAGRWRLRGVGLAVAALGIVGLAFSL